MIRIFTFFKKVLNLSLDFTASKEEIIINYSKTLECYYFLNRLVYKDIIATIHQFKIIFYKFLK